MRKMLVLLVAIAAFGVAPAGAYHDRGCGGGVNFGGGNPATHNWLNACTGIVNVHFFGTFGNTAGGDPSGWCGYIIVETEGPVDMYAGMAGDMDGGSPRPILVGPGNGDWAPHHPGGPRCKTPLP